MENQKSIKEKIEELEMSRTLEELFVKFFEKADRIIKGLKRVCQNPEEQQTILVKLATEDNCLNGFNLPQNREQYHVLFFQKDWSNLFGTDMSVLHPEYAHPDFSKLTEDQVKELYNFLYEELIKLKNSSREVDIHIALGKLMRNINMFFINLARGKNMDEFARKIFFEMTDLVKREFFHEA